MLDLDYMEQLLSEEAVEVEVKPAKAITMFENLKNSCFNPLTDGEVDDSGIKEIHDQVEAADYKLCKEKSESLSEVLKNIRYL